MPFSASLLLEFPNDGFLSVRQNTGDYLIDSRLFSYGLRCPLIVACQHDHMNSHVLQLSHCLRTVLLDRVRDSDNTEKLFIRCEKQRCLSKGGQPFCLLPHVRRHMNFLCDKAEVASVETLDHFIPLLHSGLVHSFILNTASLRSILVCSLACVFSAASSKTLSTGHISGHITTSRQHGSKPITRQRRELPHFGS